MFVMVNTKKFPREYGHGRANYINGPRVAGARSLPAKLDPVISKREARTASEACTGSGPQAPSFKLQASSFRTNLFKHQATSVKPQAASFKRQAASSKFRDSRSTEHGYWRSIRGARTKGLC